MKRIERGRARRQALAITRQLEARVDADLPHVREIVDVEAGEVARLLGGAERAEGGGDLFVVSLCEARAFRQIGAADDAECQARIAPLQEADGRLDRGGVAL